MEMADRGDGAMFTRWPRQSARVKTLVKIPQNADSVSIRPNNTSGSRQPNPCRGRLGHNGHAKSQQGSSVDEMEIRRS